jgi:hypothetical protein
MVYLFQRPETMPRAWAKAQAELRPGAWLASLEFAVPDVSPTLIWNCPDGRPVWLYQRPLEYRKTEAENTIPSSDGA